MWRSYLDQVPSLHRLQDMLARLRVMNEWVALRAAHNLEVLGTRLTENRFGRHLWGTVDERRRDKIFQRRVQL